MASMTGEILKISLFGQSHSEGIGVVIDGLPAGIRIDLDALQAFLDRRAPGRAGTTARKEADRPRFLSGLVDGVSCGAPICAVIENGDVRSQDYARLRDCPRPSHADYAAYQKYGRYHDIRGGGHFSGRLTAALCIAGGICLQVLQQRGVRMAAHIACIGGIEDDAFDPMGVEDEVFTRLSKDLFPVLNPNAREKMQRAIEDARAVGDSLGGSVEMICQGLPAGLGQPLFDGVENRLSQLFFAIPAVKAVEFGDGTRFAGMRGSAANDPFVMDENDEVRTSSNHCGGILGGITSGMPLLARLSFKPTPSIALAQNSVSLSRREDTELVIGGRHDPCVVVRAVPCVQAAAAIALLDLLLEREAEIGLQNPFQES